MVFGCEYHIPVEAQIHDLRHISGISAKLFWLEYVGLGSMYVSMGDMEQSKTLYLAPEAWNISAHESGSKNSVAKSTIIRFINFSVYT